MENLMNLTGVKMLGKTEQKMLQGGGTGNPPNGGEDCYKTAYFNDCDERYRQR